MLSPAPTNRTYAYFKLDGVFDHADVTRLIGMEPTESWNAGDDYVSHGRKLRRRSSAWTLQSGLDDTDPLERHVAALLDRLAPHRAGLLTAGTLAKPVIVCVGSYSHNFDWELDFNHQRLATALGVGFRFDFYGLSDPHEEMLELRARLAQPGSN